MVLQLRVEGPERGGVQMQEEIFLRTEHSLRGSAVAPSTTSLHVHLELSWGPRGGSSERQEVSVMLVLPTHGKLGSFMSFTSYCHKLGERDSSVSGIVAVLFHPYNSPPEDVVPGPLPLGIHPSTAFPQGPTASTYDVLPEDFSWLILVHA